ncbi:MULTISPECIES: terminase TerL endonuclease subunit [unclassified Geobacillus]|uniref:terminase large subunit n=1 Tax=unclassified Geobacillus TaxID=2642459 RepID=UPI000D34018E|nr:MULTISPECIES: terminase TerL endonuclease subunit [unclassified Geobacillus]PUF85768.1 terminase large subunit [Geobacillus sp. LYN3]TXK89062.1 terminase large subunit [Geobacillus sp. AYS3]
MLKQWLIDYCHDVLNGDIIACQKHKWACRRFLRDVEREGTDEFPYVFDEEKALRFLNWMTLFKHTKGKLAGQRIEPAPIQVFVFGNIYGWVHKETGLRRFKKAYWQVARKNAKSQSLACVGSYEVFAFGESMAEVYIGATKTEQSKIVWNEIKAQIQGCDFLKGKYKIAYGKIEHLKSGSFIAALSKDAGKTGDGLNVQCGIIDEYHAHPTSEIYDVLVSGMGARPQPLMMIITTAGFELQHPCYSVEYQYVSKILDPNNPIENDEYFVMINELDKDDDIKDERNWEKANPILCSYEEGLAYLRGELKTALDVPEKMRNFLTKNMNVWVNMRENGYMDMSKWAACGQDFDLSILEGLECVVGVDLSAKIDLTSVGFIFKKDGKYIVLGHSFMPEDTLNQKRRTDKVPYDLWVRQGWITATPGAVVDYGFIKAYIKNFTEKYNIRVREICADPWNATQFMQDMEAEGYTVIEIRQGIQTLGGPTKDFREQVYSGNLIHNNNPVLTWAISNAVTRQDANENIMLDKSKSSERIDPIAAVINAHVRAMLRDDSIDINQVTEDYLKMMGW